jgi:hypothetical protein
MSGSAFTLETDAPVLLNPPGPDQENPVPPAAEKLRAEPAQTGLLSVMLTEGKSFTITRAVADELQPSASVMVTLYEPAIERFA